MTLILCCRQVIGREIVEDLEAALSEFAAIAEALERAKAYRRPTKTDEQG